MSSIMSSARARGSIYASVPAEDAEPALSEVSTSDAGGGVAGGEAAAAVSEPRVSRVRRAFAIAMASVAWLASSTGIVIANRWIMVELAWSYPMAVAAMGMAVSGLFAWLACDVLRLGIPPAHVSPKFYFKCVFPIGLLQAMAMWLSNTLYLLLTIAFIEMARALLPLFIMLALYIARLETPTNNMIRAVCIIALGCMIASYGELHLTVLGLLCLAGNFTFEASRLVLMQVLLVGQEFHVLQGLKLIAPPTVVCLLSMSAVTELPRMIEANSFAVVAANWPLFLVAACMGLCVNLVSNVVIKVAGSTALKVLSAMRGPLLVMCSVLLLAETVTGLQFFGYVIGLVGFMWYNHAKATEASKQPASAK